MTTPYTKQTLQVGLNTSKAKGSLSKTEGQSGEWFWFFVCFLLFVILGPFSCPVVLVTLIKLGVEAEGQVEPQPVL